MKLSITGPRNAANLSEAIHQRLNMYALALVVAVLSLIGLTQPSEAKIVYTKANVHIGRNGIYNLDLNNDGITDFTIWRRDGKCPSYGGESETPANGNGAEGAPPEALSKGDPIGPSQTFYGGSGGMYWYERNNKCQPIGGGGTWWNLPKGAHYLGLMFQIGGKAHYGWARLVGRAPTTLTGYAYETKPGKAIEAGQTREADESDEESFGPSASMTFPIPDRPQPASLGMPALGAQGVPLWRRKESVERNAVNSF